MGGGVLAALTKLCLCLWLWPFRSVIPTHTQVVSSCQQTINPLRGKYGVSFIVQFSSVEPGTTVVLSNTDCWGNGFVVKLLGFPWSRPLCLFRFSIFLAPSCFWPNTLFLAPWFLLGTQACFDFSSWGDLALCVVCSHTRLLRISEKSVSNSFWDTRLHKLQTLQNPQGLV